MGPSPLRASNIVLCLVPLLWASSCDRELTATLHSEQYNSFLALSSSVSGLDGLVEAGGAKAPETGGPTPGCSELALPLLQPGEEEEGGEVEVGGIKGGVGLGMRGHTEGAGESIGGVGGVVRGGRGPGASRGMFICDRGRVSSALLVSLSGVVPGAPGGDGEEEEVRGTVCGLSPS